MIRHVLVGLLVGGVLGFLHEIAGGPLVIPVTFALCIAGLLGSAYLSDRRRARASR